MCEEKLTHAISKFLPPDRIEYKCKRLMKYLDRNGYIIKYVKKKFYFITKHNNYDEVDFVRPLEIAAMAAFYQTIPFKERLHTVNTIKSAIHNAGINEIERFVAKKRSRLTEDGVTQISLSSKNESDQVYDKEISDSKNITDNEDRTVLKISVIALLHKYSGKKRRVLQLLMRKNINSFLEYISAQESRTFSSVDDFKAFCKTPEYFLETIRQYVNVDDKRFYNFLDEIKEKLK